MQSKSDRRVERTKRDLKNAFLSLIEEKRNIGSITIIDICKLANYNRATFYAHYADKESLQNEITKDTIAEFIKSYQDPYKDKKRIIDFRQLKSEVIKIFEYVEQNASLFSLLFNNEIFPGFQQQLGYAIEKLFKDEFELTGKHFETMNKDLYIHIESYSTIAMIDFWIASDFTYSARYMTDQLLHRINSSPDIIKIKNQDTDENKNNY